MDIRTVEEDDAKTVLVKPAASLQEIADFDSNISLSNKAWKNSLSNSKRSIQYRSHLYLCWFTPKSLDLG